MVRVTAETLTSAINHEALGEDKEMIIRPIHIHSILYDLSEDLGQLTLFWSHRGTN